MGSSSSNRAALTAVLREPNLRRLQLALTGSAIGDWASMTAITIYAYQEGGAAAVGIFAAVRFLAAAVAGPLGAAVADRVSRRRFMMTVDLARALVVAVTGAIIVVDGPALVVYVLAVVTTVVGASFRAAQAGLVPRLVSSPSELTAMNGVAGNIENAVSFVGPALGAVLVTWVGVAPVIWLNAATFVWSFALVAAVRVPVRDEDGTAGAADPAAGDEGADEEDESTWVELTAGFALVARDRDLRTITLLTCAQTFLWGALTVYLVVLAEQQLATGAAGVGYLNALFGVGAVVGGLLVLTRLSKQKLAQDMFWGVVGWAVPLLVIAVAPTPWVIVAMLVLVGLADPYINLGFDTIPQRLASERTMSRVYAAADALTVAAVALGALVAPTVLALLGLSGALVAMSLLVLGYAVLTLPRLRALDERLREPDGIDLLRGVAAFRPLPPARLEELAHHLEVLEVAAGHVVVAEGGTSDRFYVIESGEVEVTQAGAVLRREGAGEFFGEIGLLRDVPRTATVRAVVPTRLRVLGRAEFLGAVTGTGAARSALDEIVTGRLLG